MKTFNILVLFVGSFVRGNCALECKTGQYPQDGTCRECKSKCAKCISEFLCMECKAGFFGDVCTKNCSEGCFEKRCDTETGACLSCEKGYYNETCERCPENCTECLNADTCTNCTTGYTGSICQKRCVNCKPYSGCSLQKGICKDGCKDGYSGYSCLQQCSSNCLSCNRIDAKKCISCVEGRYGSNCEKCPPNCTDKSCSKETGACTHGCQNGFWGDQCENFCPVNCLDGKCLRSSGLCFDGCRGNFTGTKCLCPSTCVCDADGACTKCDDNTGYVCDNQCRSVCINNICSADTERKCLYGCRDGNLCSQPLTDLETDDGKSYVTIIVILVVLVTGILLCVFGVTVCIKRRKARLSDGTQLATSQSCEEGCPVVATEMCNLRYPVPSKESDLPSNVGKHYRDQDKDENGHEYRSLLETCREPIKETQSREVILSGQQPAEVQSSSAEKSSKQSGEPAAQETGIEEVSPEKSFGGHTTVDFKHGKGTVQETKKSSQVPLRTKVPLKKLENLEADKILTEFKVLSTCTETQEDDETNDYELLKLPPVAKAYHDSLNACYIDGYKKTETYIACATPVPKDNKLFWSMVWDEGCDRIVMLTDGGVDKQDEHYWPEHDVCFIGKDLAVKCLSHDDYVDFSQRMFELKGKTEERIVLQLNFMAWPENLERMSADNLIEFRKYRETLPSEKTVPVIVHCSDGIGRTGTYIAFESLIQEGKATGSVDVFACVKRLREQRSITQELQKHGKTIVQNYVQYYFLYQALQRWFKQDQQGYKRRKVVSRQTTNSSYELVEPKRENTSSMFNLLHVVDIQKD